MQLYEQIEKEFDEKFVDKIVLESGYLVYEGWKDRDSTDDVRLFLKQSFVKFLEDECDRLEKSKKEELHACVGANCPRYCFNVEHNQALSDTILHHQNMIKELHD